MSGTNRSSQLKVIVVAGARPNFMKIAPLVKEMVNFPEITPLIVHTGQHYDREMSRLFFEELGIPEPDINLEVGSGSHATQTADIMKRFERVVLEQEPHLVVVVGDVNSTLACALVSVKLRIRVAHVEAGLRSFDRTMPEEINRVLADAVSDLLFTTEESANENLKREGIPEEKIFYVGNVMVDTLLGFKDKARSLKTLENLGLDNGINSYALLTLHRPSNVDDRRTLRDTLDALKLVADTTPILFPCHPRTRKKVEEFNLMRFFGGREGRGIYLLNPMSYLEFLSLMLDAKLVFTDSGGIQEETTVLGIPCLTLRDNTERPVTVREGTNVIVGNSRAKLLEESHKVLRSPAVRRQIPRMWDGKAAQRIVEILIDYLRKENEA